MQAPAQADAGKFETARPWDGLQFSPQPSESEIFNARVFDEPLVPIGGEPGAEENKALADALAGYSCRANLDDFSSLTGFLAAFPQSAWAGSLLLHLGTEYYNYGHYSKALAAWEQAWKQCEALDDPKSKAQVDRALGELAQVYSKLGRARDLKELLDSTANRPLTGPGAQLVHSAQQGLWMMQNRPEVSFRCGPLALNSVLADSHPNRGLSPLIFNAKSTTNGYSLAQLSRLSWDLGMNYQAAFRSPGAAVIVPAVVHWKVAHYAAMLQKDGDRFLIQDLTFRGSLRMSVTALDEEASGYFLVPPGPLLAGWRAVSDAEAQAIWGKGNVASQDPNQTGPTATQTGGNPGEGNGDPNDPGNGTSGNSDDPPPGATNLDPTSVMNSTCSGMTTYTMNTMLASLSLNDTPVGYRTPVGPWVKFTATYNQNNANQPATFSYSSLGPDWTCNWISYITDDSASPGVKVSCYAPGGGTLSFTGYNPTNKTFAPELMTQAILRMTSTSTYELQFRTGARREFTLSNGALGSTRKIFLTQVIDPAGNSVQVNYDSSHRITSIVDAIGQATTLTYGDAAFPYTITEVTDPFGRSATFHYNAQGLLTQITDVFGLPSQYIYGTNDFVSALVTPYGTTTFAGGTTNGATWLQATDPLGEKQLAIATPNSTFPTVPISDPASTLPARMPEYNGALNYRDTFFWSKQAFQEGTPVYTNATVYHFLHDADVTTEGGVLESVQKPLEHKVWFYYPGQSANNVLGPQSINRPSAVGRVLDDGTTQLFQFQYNPLGAVTNSTDPVGRNFTYVYSTNNVDLLAIQMTRGGQNELQRSITYNAQHRPLTITDASGQTTTNTYNARGQILTRTNPLGETSSFSYSASGYLLSITGPLQTSNDVTTLTHDVFGRVQSITDTEGYTLTYTYDAIDRVTSVTHPDGTAEQFVYSNLDLVASADRLGRWTTNTYNADRQLISRQDPLGRITRYQYCHCGALETLFDPLGNATSWDRDIQSRIITKHYADGSTVNYAYEKTTSRLHSRLDEKAQQTSYQYYKDNKLASVSYSNAVIATPSVTFSYDTNYDRLVAMQDAVGTTTYTYNTVSPNPALGAGRLLCVNGPLPSSLVTYQYDQLERVTSRAINGVAEDVTFDVLGRPTKVTNALGSSEYSYIGATRRLASGIYPNGLTNLYTYYDNTGDERLMQIRAIESSGVALPIFNYRYNSVGQVTSRSTVTSGGLGGTARTENYGYDAGDQLISDSGTQTPGVFEFSYAYTYDAAGNRLSASGPGLGPAQNLYYNALNEIVGSSATLPTVSYQWDAENRLVTVIRGTNTSRFAYDGLGRRMHIVELTNGAVQSDTYYL